MNAKTETTPALAMVNDAAVNAVQQTMATRALVATNIANAYEIDSPEMVEAAMEDLRDWKRRADDTETERKSFTDPLNAIIKRLIDAPRAYIDDLRNGERILKAKILAYQQAEEARAAQARRAAEQRALEERRAFEAAEREAERKAQEALQAGNVEAHTAACDAVEFVREQRELAEVAPIVAHVAPVTKAAGTSTRANWKAEVTDFKALVIEAAKRAEAGDEFLLGMLAVDQKQLDVAAKAMKNNLNIPGVRAYNNASLAVRAK